MPNIKKTYHCSTTFGIDPLFDRLPEEPVMQKWWAYMGDMMETNMDNSPVSKVLKEVFYLG